MAAKKVDASKIETLKGVKNTYDPFALDFLHVDEEKRIWNGEFEVTNTPKRLIGVSTGDEEIKLTDYLVYRPVPKELLQWRDIPNYHPDSLDMENWYAPLFKYSYFGVWVDGEYYNPFFIYWLNVFVFPVPILDKDGDPTADFITSHPQYCNIDRYFLDYCWKAYLNNKDCAIMGGRGVGKNAWFSTTYATPNGFIPVGDLNIGDEIFAATGEITTITGVRDYGEDSPMYNVTLQDGRVTNCGTGHLWSVYEYNKKGLQTLEAIDIAERLHYGTYPKGGNRFHVPIAAAVEYTTQHLIVDPYLLGFLLGDGTICGNGVRISTEDMEVVNTFQRTLGPDFEMVKDPTTVSWRATYRGKIRKKDSRGRDNICNPFIEDLKAIGVWETRTKTKRIPTAYLYSSIEQRFELLRGLMDSDGYAHNRGYQAEYYSINLGLANDVALLARSLGIKCRIREDKRKGLLKGYSVSMFTGAKIFNLERKQSILLADDLVPSKVRDNRYRTAITSMELETTRKEKSRCIEIAHPSHLYLANDYIITHNSYLYGSIMDREFRLMPASHILVSSTNEDTTGEAWSKVEACSNAIETLHRALKLKLIVNSADEKFSGEKVELPDGSTENRGHLSKLEKIMYGKNPDKTRGKRPSKQLIEEFAAFPPSHQKGSLGACKRVSRGSWYVGASIKKCQVLYSGTGGTVENDEAEGIFCNPSAHEILPTNDFEIESGFFCPTHIKRAGTWERTGCPNITLATDETLRERELVKSDITTYTGLLQEYPMTIKEVFMRKGTNIFNQDKIATQRINISMGGDKIPRPEKGFLKWNRAENGKIIGVTWDPSSLGDIEILEHPHWLTEHALEDEKTPMTNLYVAGCDSIDQGTGDSSYAKDNKKGSELAIIVKKRMLEKGYFRTTSNIYVARYVKRSQDVRTDWDNALKLAFYFNSEVNIEYTKIGIVSHFRDHGFYHLLKKRPTINQQNADPNRQTSLIGTTAAGPIIDHQDQKIKSYIDDFYDTIWFPEVLEQLQDYNRQDRTKFDMVIAMGLCELSDEDLMGKNVKPPEKAAGGLQLFGYYTEYRQDGTPIKKYGVIPSKSNEAKDFDKSIRQSAESFATHGGVRWIDTSDPSNPIYMYD